MCTGSECGHEGRGNIALLGRFILPELAPAGEAPRKWRRPARSRRNVFNSSRGDSMARVLCWSTLARWVFEMALFIKHDTPVEAACCPELKLEGA